MKKQKITLLSYIKRNKLLFGGYLLFTTFSHLVNIVSIFLIAAFIAEITVVNFDLAFTYLIYGTILIVLRRIFYMTAGLFFIKMFGKMAFEMRYDLVNHSFKLTSQTYSESSSGKFIKRISQDPEQAIESMDSIVEPISIIFGFLITIIYIITINIWIGLLVITTVIGLVILELIRTKIFYKNRKLVKIADENIASLVGEIVRSEKDIKALNLENELIEVSNKNFLNYKECFNKSYIKNETLSGFRNVIFELCLAVILIVGLTFVQNTYITLASFLFIFMNRDALNSAIYCFGLITQNISMCKLSSQRMFELFDAEKYPIEKFGNTEMAECRGEISFDNVSFYYDKTNEDKKEENNKTKESKKIKNNAKENENSKIEKRTETILAEEKTDDTNNYILKNLSFKIPAGKTVAFVGKSGSGKTTILSLINKLYVVKSGTIFVDDININNLTKESLRSSISLVNQYPYIFNESIKNNLLMVKNDATEEELWNVCKKANLDKFIETLPKKLDTVIGEGGIKLSGGQRQRLAIARAFLKKSKIILFDESTSSLDNHAQNDIKNSIAELHKNHTVVIVAHRLSTIVNCDLIYFLENGEIKDVGTFTELFERNEKFNSLFVAETV
ncbi:MAG: ABC transporter ATP-binding protein [Clostridia bacterium]|nr:ABC transporter ATP-binding protein [Clostridia bacterium]